MKELNKKNLYEIVHMWANSLIKKEYKRGNYVFTPSEIKHNSQTVAKTYNRSIILLKNWDNRGIYGNNISTQTIAYAVPKSKKVYSYYTFPNDNVFNNDDAFKEWYKEEFMLVNDMNLYNLSVIKYHISNNRSNADTDININFHPVLLPSSKGKLRLIKSIIINETVDRKRYTSWNSYHYISVKLNTTIGKLLNYKPEYVFTKKEIEIYRFRYWHEKYSKGYTPIPEARKIYNDPILKDEYQRKRLESIRQYKERKERERLKRLKERHAEILKYYDKWYIGDVEGIAWFDQPYQTLRIKDNNVQTSMNVRIELKEAKLLYNLVKNKPNRLKGVIIAGYTCLGIKPTTINLIENEELITKEVDCLIVGCHTIPLFEIDNFVKRNKLDW